MQELQMFAHFQAVHYVQNAVGRRSRRTQLAERSVQGAETGLDSAGVTLKCLPHEKSAQGEILTDLIGYVSPLLKYRWPYKKSPHFRIAPPEKSPRPTIYR